MPNPRIPEQIVIHLGAPDSDAMNVTESFADYIKNVASSEIFPTWPEQALRANILAQISVALNRVYTEFYRSRGYNFDITSSPAYDQTYVYGRDIFSNISEIVDEIFDSYIRREEFIEPLFATFCDGVEVQCDGLEQWGSVRLADEGRDYFSILQNYYGNDIVIEENVPVENIQGSAPPVTLREGDTGRDVELIQRKLNRISTNYPGIPKIFPADGFFDRSTTDAVRKFQEVFNLEVDGLVGRATWNQIQFIYNAVKKLYTVNSEGIRITDVSTRFSDTLSEGSSGDGVLTVQYYLSYIALFVPTVQEAALDGSFGPTTSNAVRSFQRTYDLPETGVVDRATWDRMEQVYFEIVSEIDYEFFGGRILPFPGRILREGIEGNDVRVLQEYLNYIALTYTEIPRVNVDGVFGPSTANQVRELKTLFDLPGDHARVNAPVWNSIASIYDDLYTGNTVNEGQYPGYEIS
ncbi:MAG: peptidoglycan-binding protein [Clostridia bacterium]|nr:peptidoglycan-binding protein [Clostridia bacterium]